MRRAADRDDVVNGGRSASAAWALASRMLRQVLGSQSLPLGIVPAPTRGETPCVGAGLALLRASGRHGADFTRGVNATTEAADTRSASGHQVTGDWCGSPQITRALIGVAVACVPLKSASSLR